MYSSVFSAGLTGIEGYCISVEADISDGLPVFTMVGYLASEVKEAQERVKTALKNSGIRIPPKRITINLSPADLRKEGTRYDLPIAAAILSSLQLIPTFLAEKSMFIGELGLNGEIRPVKGILSLVSTAKKEKIPYCFLPEANWLEGRVIEGVQVIGVRTISQLVTYLRDPQLLPDLSNQFSEKPRSQYQLDYAQVNGQVMMKRATEIAVAGHHNILYIGPPGSGKTMVAKRIPTIMPLMTKEEQLEVSKIYSICGLLPVGQPILFERPFREPHQTITSQALCGGGKVPKPGELSLASKGVLFLDELPEFTRQVLEQLRQPLEEHRVTISRHYGSYQFPADFFLAAAMNPCHCGYYPDRTKCSCSENQVKKYLHKISRALLNRIDICVEAKSTVYEDLVVKQKNESSETIKIRVEKAVSIQQQRFKHLTIKRNSQMSEKEIRKFCKLKQTDEMLLADAFKLYQLSSRSYFKILRVARTAADLTGSEHIERNHILEAIGYRSLEEQYWGVELK